MQNYHTTVKLSIYEANNYIRHNLKIETIFLAFYEYASKSTIKTYEMCVPTYKMYEKC